MSLSAHTRAHTRAQHSTCVISWLHQAPHLKGGVRRGGYGERCAVRGMEAPDRETGANVWTATTTETRRTGPNAAGSQPLEPENKNSPGGRFTQATFTSSPDLRAR